MYIPISNKSTYSIGVGLPKPYQIAYRAYQIGANATVLTDIGNIAGAVEFQEACKTVCKCGLPKKTHPTKKCEKYDPINIKPILGYEADIEGIKLLVIAKNKDGWQELLDIINNEKTINDLTKYKNIIFVYKQSESLKEEDISSLKSLPSLYLGIIRTNLENQEQQDSVSNRLREYGHKYNIPCVALNDSYYCEPKDCQDHRIVLCTHLKAKFSTVNTKLVDSPEYKCFFESNNYYIPTYEEMEKLHTKKELENTISIGEQCDNYSLVNAPMFPNFVCPSGYNHHEYLRQLCRDGWVRKIKGKIPKEKEQEYADRVKHELDIFEEFGLSTYFLVVGDYINWAKNNGILVGPGRGCLSNDSNIITSDFKIKNIKDIDIGESVFTIDGTINKVKNKFIYENKESLLNIKCQFGDFTGVSLTKDHKIFAIKREKNRYDTYITNIDEANWYEARELKPYDMVYIPKLKRNNIKDIKYIDLDKYSDDKRLFTENNLCIHKIKNILTNNYKIYNKYSRYVKVDNDFLRLLGLFTGDGWLVKRSDNLFGVCFNTEDKKNINWLLDYINKLGWKITENISKTKKLVQYQIFNPHFVKFLEEHFNEYKYRSNTKHIPQFVFSLGEDLIKSFLYGYFYADGHICKCKAKIDTTSKKLAYQTKLALQICNCPSSVYLNIRKPDKRGFNNQLVNYCIGFAPQEWLGHKLNKISKYKIVDNGVFLPILSVKEITGHGIVYDLEIENNHNYLTSSFIVHNSVGGSLTAYLTGITERVNPIEYNLILERFINRARMSKDKLMPPDIDTDFPKHEKDRVIEYIKGKYGEDKVAQICTFGTKKGRSALKDVLTVREACSFDEMNEMTKHIPDESKISDDLQKMIEEDGEASIIWWALENKANELRNWCYINDNGELEGDYAQYFEQAIRLEGCKRSIGRHASGFIISPIPLKDMCQLVKVKKCKDLCIGLDMRICESIGLIKVDLLGLALLSKMQRFSELLATQEY